MILPASGVFAQIESVTDSTATLLAAPVDSARVPWLEKTRFGLTRGATIALTFEAHYPTHKNVNWLFRQEEQPLTRFDLVLHGVGQGANTAGFLAALGAAVGFWDESTAWALIAAGASVGAIWSGLSTQDVP